MACSPGSPATQGSEPSAGHQEDTAAEQLHARRLPGAFQPGHQPPTLGRARANAGQDSAREAALPSYASALAQDEVELGSRRWPLCCHLGPHRKQ
uniref:Uncharacterized protein LOC110201776 isoform X3 n=1 Tax=Phascolarctos cinereus TaxID=38626 RepID=A0A6P5JQ14_PHACI|nr:uncharacterized protein LOC110201776 isoform X3 [Phascolarctos cinereus]